MRPCRRADNDMPELEKLVHAWSAGAITATEFDDAMHMHKRMSERKAVVNYRSLLSVTLLVGFFRADGSGKGANVDTKGANVDIKAIDVDINEGRKGFTWERIQGL